MMRRCRVRWRNASLRPPAGFEWDQTGMKGENAMTSVHNAFMRMICLIVLSGCASEDLDAFLDCQPTGTYTAGDYRYTYTTSADAGNCAYAKERAREAREERREDKEREKKAEERARRYVIDAAQGDANMKYTAGTYYEKGSYGIGKDLQTAIQWYRLAAIENSKPARAALSRLGQPVPPIADAYKTDMDRAADAFDNGREKEAFRYWLAAANKGTLEAYDKLAWMYLNGRGVAQNDREALKWYTEAAKSTASADHMIMVGAMYLDGRGVPPGQASDREALGWFKKAAEKESAVAQTEIGRMYEHGRGVKRNYQIAAVWYRRGANGGDPGGQFRLGRLYEMGLGLPKDSDEAVKWYREAVKNGSNEAADALTRLGQTS